MSACLKPARKRWQKHPPALCLPVTGAVTEHAAHWLCHLSAPFSLSAAMALHGVSTKKKRTGKRMTSCHASRVLAFSLLPCDAYAQSGDHGAGRLFWLNLLRQLSQPGRLPVRCSRYGNFANRCAGNFAELANPVLTHRHSLPPNVLPPDSVLFLRCIQQPRRRCSY